MGAIRVFILCLAASCVSTGSTLCADGRVCPGNTVCASVADQPLCVSPEQVASCNGVPQFGSCGDNLSCYDGVCLPGGCGNGILDPGEACDDGNLLPGDGCSAVCLEEKCGNGAIDIVLGEECDDGMAGASADGCSSTCKLEVLGWDNISPTPITARVGMSLAYDAARGVTVAFGGLGPNATYGDTWTWDQTTWTKLDPPASPPGRYDAGMTYDSVRKRVVLFGGFNNANLPVNDTWEWDGVTWTEMHPTTVPAAIAGAQLAYDVGRAKVMLVDSGTTYAWDGTDWTVIGTAPPAWPLTTLLGYDVANDQLLLCGNKNDHVCHTFVLTGSTWTELATATTRPNSAYGGRVAYDGKRGKLVLFGGHGEGPGSLPVLDTSWEWSGTNWVVTTPPAPRPSARADVGLAYDGNQVVLYGGDLGLQITAGDTWLYSGTAWAQQTPPLGPAARSSGVMASNPSGGSLMYGGYNAATSLIETWLWGPNGWSRLATQNYPVVYRDAAMTFDTKRGRYVLFGGSDGTNKYNDTWEYFAQNWLKRTDALGMPSLPAPRISAGLAFDGERGVTVLFGGTTGAGTVDDTWTFDGTTWTAQTPSASPSAQDRMALAYAADRKRVVMFGANAETWEWDGGNWTLVPTTTAPPARVSANLVYEPILHGVVLYGGRDGNGGQIFGDVWLWNGSEWTQLQAANAPDPRFAAMAVYDSLRHGLVTFGGRENSTESAETNLLLYRGLVPPEACGFANEDTDGDGLAGCADPDCAGRCASCGDGTCSLNEDYLICPADCSN